MRLVLLLISISLVAAACSEFPKDTEGTSENVEASGMRLGWIEGDRDDRDIGSLVGSLERSTGRPARVEFGSAEMLLTELEAGKLDLVVGTFDAKSPWISRVTFSRPVAVHERPYGTVEAKAAMRNGEHAWAVKVDEVVLKQAPK